MTALDLATAVLCGLTAARLLLFARAGAAHRPYAGLLAYLLIVAFAGQALLIAFGQVRDTSAPQAFIDLVITAAIWSTRGNVVELFRPLHSHRAPLLMRLLRRETWM